ncbi:Endonuclease/exonuclease/phosphatase [Earliella scabrosa]|nr:Endonuclease/exonuclease/phosphatase [Earliella scabrosa]
MNGYGNLVPDHQDNKWSKVYRMMMAERIGVLLLQETHLTEARRRDLHDMFPKKIKIFSSAHPTSPTQREGVAVVLNAKYLKVADAEATEVIPGRAIQINVMCLGNTAMRILCVYAPTSEGAEERRAFFVNLRQYYETHPNLPKPHLIAGDFNTVEDSIDRLPVPNSTASDVSVEALDDLKLSLGLMLVDGWRATHPTSRDYTFHRGSGAAAVFSRLDRIYVTSETFRNAREWKISEAGIKTDHSLVSVELTSVSAPVVGPGRPIFPLQLLKDKPLAKQIKDRGLAALDELHTLDNFGARTDETNPQTILHKFKIRDCERALKAVKANPNLQDSERRAEAAALTKQIQQLKQRRFKQQQQNARATHRLYGNKPTKYWSKLHKEQAPRDFIPAFLREDRRGAADTVKMAEMARAYHHNIQRDDPATTKTPNERERDIQTALDSLDTKISAHEFEELDKPLEYDECEVALRCAKSGSAPGMDGIPFEVWKTLHARYEEDSRFPDRQCFDVLRLLKAAFEDIHVHGVAATTSFAEGWMAPIYKEKGERTRIANYRPITLLNTDYKLLSKMLARPRQMGLLWPSTKRKRMTKSPTTIFGEYYAASGFRKP